MVQKLSRTCGVNQKSPELSLEEKEILARDLIGVLAALGETSSERGCLLSGSGFLQAKPGVRATRRHKTRFPGLVPRRSLRASEPFQCCWASVWSVIIGVTAEARPLASL